MRYNHMYSITIIVLLIDLASCNMENSNNTSSLKRRYHKTFESNPHTLVLIDFRSQIIFYYKRVVGG